MNENIPLNKIIEEHQIWLRDRSKGRRAYLGYLDLRDAKFPFADLRYADLTGADLTGADLSNVNFSNAKMRYSCLRSAYLINANLRKADLYYADLSRANLNKANLSGANLSFARLCETDLYRAKIHGAHLANADLSYATVRERIFCLDRIGSFKRRTTYNVTKDIVWCGCFKGTFKQWVAEIRKTYPNKNDPYRKQYEAAIAYFKSLAGIK